MGEGRGVSGMTTNRWKYGVHSSPDTSVSENVIGMLLGAYSLQGGTDPGSTCSKTPALSGK